MTHVSDESSAMSHNCSVVADEFRLSDVVWSWFWIFCNWWTPLAFIAENQEPAVFIVLSTWNHKCSSKKFNWHDVHLPCSSIFLQLNDQSVTIAMMMWFEVWNR